LTVVGGCSSKNCPYLHPGWAADKCSAKAADLSSSNSICAAPLSIKYYSIDPSKNCVTVKEEMKVLSGKKQRRTTAGS
jgi:hypothetical protein